MCGIFGYYSNDKLDIESNILDHRGPDSWGVSYDFNNDKCLTLFHSRLQIIGLGVQGHQPFKLDNFNSTLVFNGEIFNYKFIKEELKNTFNATFNSQTDTEVLYQCLNYNGISKTLDLINGQFAFAYYDKDSKNLYIARDNLGIKPLYYFHDKSNFAFSSEIKSFFELEIFEPELNKDLLGEYLANGWIYEPDTLFKGVYKLNSGNFLKYNFEDNQLSKNEYWSINNNSTKRPDIEKVINNQLISDVNLGVYFSGGYDSTLITTYLLNKNLEYFNLDIGQSESKTVKYFDNEYDLNLTKIKPKKFELKTYDKLIYYLDEPISDPAIFPAYDLAKSSKEKGCTVMLSGMGGDEVDSGYNRHRVINNLKLLKLIPSFFYNFIPGLSKRDSLRLKYFLKNPSPENYFSLTSYFNEKEISELVNYKWYENYRSKIKKIANGYKKEMKYYLLDIKGFLSSHNLIYMDKCSMAASVEVRLPLLDKDFVSYMMKDLIKKNKFGSKTRIKKFLMDSYKKKSFKIKKEGFTYPIDAFLKDDIDWFDVIKFFNKNKILDTKKIKKLIELINSDIDLVRMKLWHIYTLYRWLIIFKVKS